MPRLLLVDVRGISTLIRPTLLQNQIHMLQTQSVATKPSLLQIHMLQTQSMATKPSSLLKHMLQAQSVATKPTSLQNHMLQTQSLATKPSYLVHRISSSLELMTRSDIHHQKPLAVLLPWLMAEPKHTVKYAEFYLGQGFDVLTAFTKVKDVLWPKTGVKVVAGQLVAFLHSHTAYRPLLLHGFSAGGYLWGETCLIMSENIEQYQHVVDRFVGQVWDSVVEFTQSTEGFPRALFPRSRVLQVLARNFMRSYMTVCYYPVTTHYIRASQMFHANLIKAPALFLLSKTDPVATVESVRVARDGWDAMGVATYWKVWDHSPHVRHYLHHPEEYQNELLVFLNTLGLIQQSTEIKSKL